MDDHLIYTPRLNPDLCVTEFDSSATDNKYIMYINNKRHYEINEYIYQLLMLIDGVRTIEEITLQLQKKSKSHIQALDIYNFIISDLLTKGIVCDANKYVETEVKSIIKFKISLISQDKLRYVTNILKHLFSPVIFITGLTLSAAFLIYFFLFSTKPHFDIMNISAVNLAWGYLTLFLATMIHELGHSSAVNFYGAKHGEIGLGIYIYFIVFYADVSNAWTLTRWQRVVVDFAGIYFQLLVLPFIYLLYIAFSDPLFVNILYLLCLSISATLNPLLKYDGYWIASDISGIPNLRNKSRQILKSIFKLNRHSGQTNEIQLTSGSKVFLLIYSIISNTFFVYFIYKIFVFLPSIIKVYPGVISTFLSTVSFCIKNGNILGIVSAFNRIIPSTIFIVICMAMLYKLVIKKLFTFLNTIRTNNGAIK